MGTYVSLCRIDAESFDRILRKPELVMEALAPAELEQFELSLPDGPEEWVSLDKAWHGIHFLLTGTDWEGEEPLCYIVKGGSELDWPDNFFEPPPRALTPEQVRQWSTALQPIGEETLRERFDPAAMVELSIYPTIWTRDPKLDDTLGYLVKTYRGMKNFIAQAAQNGYGLVVSTD